MHATSAAHACSGVVSRRRRAALSQSHGDGCDAANARGSKEPAALPLLLAGEAARGRRRGATSWRTALPRRESSSSAVLPAAVAAATRVPERVSCRRRLAFRLSPTRRISPLTTRSAPMRRPVSTSHSPSQSASCFPCACSITSMFSRLMTRASIPAPSTSARSRSATYPASMPGPSRSCCLLRSSRTETIRVAAGSRAAAAAASAAGFGGGAAVAQAQAISRKERERIRAVYRRRPRGSSFLADGQLVLLHTQDHFSALFQISEQDPLGERLLQGGLDQPSHGAGAELGREAAVRQPTARLGEELQ